jgi:hypothetical protein
MIDRPFILGFVGIGWSVLFSRIGSEKYSEDIHWIRKMLRPEDYSTFDQLTDRHLQHLENDRLYFWLSLLLWVLGAVAVSWTLYGPRQASAVLPAWWFGGNGRFWRLLALFLLGFPASLLAVTLGCMLFVHTGYVRSLARLRFWRSAKLCLMAFQPVMRVNRIAYLSWSAGVAIFGLLTRAVPSIPYLVFLGMIGAIAAITFAGPTLAVRRKLEDLAQERLEFALARLPQPAGGAGIDDSLETVQQLENSVDVHSVLTDLNWQYLQGVFTAFLVPVIVAVISSLMTTWLSRP